MARFFKALVEKLQKAAAPAAQQPVAQQPAAPQPVAQQPAAQQPAAKRVRKAPAAAAKAPASASGVPAPKGGVRWPPAQWIDQIPLPTARLNDGNELPEKELKSVIYQQSRCADISPAPEIRHIYRNLDRSTTSDYALEVLNAFLGSGANAKEKWALAVAGLMGDDRIVSPIESSIKRWADSARGKLAEYAVHALALLASDRALLAIDNIAMRYRTKVKNIGGAAVEAFAAAADSLGVTPEELGDKVVPWIGFEPGKPRIIDCGGKQVEVRVGQDFKLCYVDLEKNKKITSLPSSASDELKAEFKELSALLRDVAKAQALRMENLMVCGRRWPVDRWQELFMDHPILAPFGQRLVWGACQQGALAGTFRALEDKSLTDRADEPYDLPEGCMVGIVHPLELDQQVRSEWQTHLKDYEIEPPFPQMDRPVVSVTPDQALTKFGKEYAKTTLNGMTFKGRAERLGWRRGSVCDGGWITTYWKSFPSAGVDAFLSLDGMYVGIDLYTDINLEDVFFTKGGTVRIGSYEYDEPNKENDQRLIAFGQVPPIVFSEVMGDLKKIVHGRSEAEE